MPNIRISDAADAGTLVASDMLPLARSGNTNAYHATMAEVAAFASTSLASGAYGNVGRNVIHNPLMNIAQRGAGPFTSVGTYTLDRWRLLFSADTNSVSAAGLVDAQRAAIGDEAAVVAIANTFTGTAGAGSYSYLQQSIEGIRRLAGKTVTVSLWAAAGSGTPRLGISLLQYFGTGGTPSASVVINGASFPITTTFARYTVTFAIPSAAGKTLGTNGDDSTSLLLWFSSGATNATQSGNVGVQSGTIAIWGVQLEIGSVATPLEKPDPRYDLSNCQRFYQGNVYFNLAAVTTAVGQAIGLGVSYPVAMRATPTLTLVNNNNVGLGTPTLYNTNFLSGTAVSTSTVSGGVTLSVNVSASADL